MSSVQYASRLGREGLDSQEDRGKVAYFGTQLTGHPGSKGGEPEAKGVVVASLRLVLSPADRHSRVTPTPLARVVTLSQDICRTR